MCNLHLRTTGYLRLVLVAFALASSALARNIYIANLAGSISVVTDTTGTVAATIPLSGSPTGLALNPAGTFLYVVQYSANTVTVINTASNTVVTTIPVGTAPLRVAVAPNGQFAYVTNTASNTVSVVQTASNTVSATIPAGPGPAAILFTPDSSRAFVMNTINGTVSAIDTASGTVTITWQLAAGSGPMAISPDGNSIYVANHLTNQVTVYDAGSGAKLTTISGFRNPDAIAISPDGSSLFVANGAGKSMSIVNTASGTVSSTVVVGSVPNAIAVSPDGSTAFVANYMSNTLSIVSVPSSNLVITSPILGGRPFAVAVQPTPLNPVYTLPTTGLPSLPSDLVLPDMPQNVPQPVFPAVSSVLRVSSCDQLQPALSGAACGQAIVVQGNLSCSGNFVIPCTVCPANAQILLTGSSDWAQENSVRGVRLQQTDVGTGNVPVLLTPNSAAALTISNGAAGWYISDMQFTTTDPIPVGVYPIVDMGDNDAVTADMLPSGIVFDRVAINAPDPPSLYGPFVQAGVDFNCIGCSFINSSCWNIVDVGQDAQCIGISNTPGQGLIANNYLEASGENLFFTTKMCNGPGPCPTQLPNGLPYAVPSDYLVIGNHFNKQLTWATLPEGCVPNGVPECYDVKNEFEVKDGQRIYVTGNVFTNTFQAGQGEFVIVNCLWIAPDTPGPYVCNDLSFVDNLFMNGPLEFVVSGNGTPDTGNRILIRNNLGVNINGANYAAPGMTGWGAFLQTQYTAYLTVDHNTAINQPPNFPLGAYFSDGAPSTDNYLWFSNNIQYGQLTADGMNGGGTIASFPSNAVIAGDVLAGDPWPNNYPGGPLSLPAYPPTVFASSSTATPVDGQPGCNYSNKPVTACWGLDMATVGFIDFTGGSAGTNLPGLALDPSSLFHNAGTDGADIGANVASVLTATTGVQ